MSPTDQRKMMQRWRSLQLRTWEKQVRPTRMSSSPNIESPPEQEEKPMLETKPKRRGGRPKGSKNRPRSAAGLRTPVEVLNFAEAYEEPTGGNGRDEPAYEPAATEPVEPAPARLHMQGSEGMVMAEKPPKPQVVLPDLFIHRVENGYIVRPAYAQGDHRTSSDVRTWVVASKEALAELVVSLIAEPVVHATPQRQSQDYYSPPLIVETGVGPMR